jgi:RNA polymerase sigma-70 factor (ECF subfamily)
MPMSETIDSDSRQLLQRARAGDASSLGRLLELYRAYLVVLARVQIGRRLQGKVDASDLVQEAPPPVVVAADRTLSLTRSPPV